MVDEEVAACIRSVTTSLEDYFVRHFDGKDYGGGIGQFVFVVVSIGSDFAQIEKTLNDFSKTGRYKDMLTGKSVKYISFSIALDPSSAMREPSNKIVHKVCNLMLHQLNSPCIDIPAKFNYEAFTADFKIATHAFLKKIQAD